MRHAALGLVVMIATLGAAGCRCDMTPRCLPGPSAEACFCSDGRPGVLECSASGRRYKGCFCGDAGQEDAGQLQN